MESNNNSDLETLSGEALKNAISGNYDKAIEIYRHISTHCSDNPVAVELANFHLGDIFIMLKNYELAEKYINVAIKLNPMKPQYHFCLGVIYVNQLQWDRAISELETARVGLPNDGDVVRMLGSAIFGSGNTAKGLHLLEDAVRLSPDNPTTLMETAIAYLLSGRSYKAVEFALRAARLNPTDLEIQTALKTILGSARGFN